MKKIVAFDFDGTLTDRDSFLQFIIFTKGYLKLILGLFYILPVWGLFKLGFVTRHNAKQIIFSYFFKGMPIAVFKNYCDAFSYKIDSLIREGVLSKIETYKNEGVTLTIVTASIDLWVKPWALRQGINTVIGTVIQVDNNVMTGQFDTLNCVKKEKVNRFLKVFPDRDTYHLTTYGNSEGDRALMQFSDKSYFNYFKK